MAIQRRVQAVSIAFLQPVRMGNKPYVLRTLQPSEDRVALSHWHGKLARLESVMSTMGTVVAWSHLRAGGREGSAIADELIGFAAKSRWKSQIAQVAEHCAAQVRSDWLAYAKAYDEGYFAKEPS